jgi:hypothetical protein
LAIITISHQYGTRGEAIATELAPQLGYSLVTPAKVNQIIRDRYQLDYSMSAWFPVKLPSARACSIFTEFGGITTSAVGRFLTSGF